MNIGKIGKKGEDAACQYLKKHRYKILARNYQKTFGEIDIIAQTDDTISFIEVKTRKNSEHGLPCEAVTLQKQKKMIRTAYAYIQERNLDANYNFDIVEVFHYNGKIVSVNHIQNAFGLE